MDIEERGIWQVHSTSISAVNADDLARLLTLMTDDVLFLNPGQAPVGRQDVPAASRPPTNNSRSVASAS